MKTLKIFFLTVLCFLGLSAQAQQNLNWGQGAPVVSPEVHADNTVTFRMTAPQAQSVQITGDFLPTQKMETPMGSYDAPGVADLVKDVMDGRISDAKTQVCVLKAARILGV